MIVDYTQFTPEVRRVVETIEEKPHLLYIRYLLTKKYSPAFIKRELWRLGLSAPHEGHLATYYLAVIDPVIEKFKLKSVYQDYKLRIMQKSAPKGYKDEILNFKVTFDGKNEALRIQFCKAIKELGLEEMWSPEIVRAYGGTIENLPLDENGERIIKHLPNHNVEKILLHPKRVYIDQMLLEEIPVNRISKILQERFQVKFEHYEIAQYARVFFNYRRKNIEELVQRLEVERNSVQAQLDLLDYDDNLSIGEKIAIRMQAEQKLEQLDENIKVLKAAYTDASFRQGALESTDLKKAWADVFYRSYERFLAYDKYKDRDIVKALEGSVKMMGYAQEHIETVEGVAGGTDKRNGDADKGKQNAALQLYRQRYEEFMQKQEQEQTGGETPEILTEDTDDPDVEGAEEL